MLSARNLTIKKILTYEDIIPYPAGTIDEPLVSAAKYSDLIHAQYQKFDMLEYTGNRILLRDTVARKLANAAKSIHTQHGYGLLVVYGYRHPEIQNRYFDKRYKELAKEHPLATGEELSRMTHNFVAIPEIAGHPTGGAVDVTLFDEATEEEVKLGSRIADYSNPDLIRTYPEHTTLTQELMQRREILHEAMTSQGFAPFYGEWWHFSYGDREWAAFYNQSQALYEPVVVAKSE